MQMMYFYDKFPLYNFRVLIASERQICAFILKSKFKESALYCLYQWPMLVQYT